MGMDTKGAVATDCKDVFFVISRVERALNRLIRPGWENDRATPGLEAANFNFKLCHTELKADSGGVQLHFTYMGEQRSMWVFFDCDCDHQDIAPQTLSLSIGCWGHSDLFMMTALESLAILGEVYFDHNDCDGEDLAKVDVPVLSYMELCAKGEAFCSELHLEKWHDLWKKGLMRKASCEAVIGLSEEEVEQVQSMHYEKANEYLKGLLQAQEVAAS